MGVKERIAYLRGLIDGSGFCADDPQAKSAWDSLLAICSDLADKVEMLEAGQAETEEYLEAIDCDLADLEDVLFGLDDDTYDGDIVEMICPECNEEIFFEEDFLYDSDVEIACPSCGAVVYATGDCAGKAHTNGASLEDIEDEEDDDM
ncbi:MAG: hypothetical protein GX162_05350 [Firmicutes bacterium]|nr:hypothetical protein [Bacillota bacterium]